MSEDIANYKKLIESVLTEDYQDRINNLAKFILQHHNTAPFKDKQDLRTYIERKIDWPLGSVSPQQVVKDVVSVLKGQLAIKSASASKGPGGRALYTQAVKHLAQLVAEQLVDEMGNIFPDGDPHDATQNVFNKILVKDRTSGTQASRQLFGVDNLDLQSLIDKNSISRYQQPKDWLWSVLYPLVLKEFKKQTGDDPWDYLSNMHDETYPGQPNPYKGERE